MSSPIFYKLSSRLGLLHAPHGYSDKNIGVEDAPDAILTPTFLKSFPGAVVETVAYPAPEAVEPGEYLQTIAALGAEIKTRLLSSMTAHPEKLPTSNLIYIGNLDCEQAEIDFISANQIKTISHKEIIITLKPSLH